jgi:glycerol uptake facilitator-like aquaporin
MGALHWGTLLRVVWASFAAGIFMTAVFSFVIFASARSGESSRAGRGGAALAFGILAGLALLVFGAGIAFGVDAMLSKS